MWAWRRGGLASAVALGLAGCHGGGDSDGDGSSSSDASGGTATSEPGDGTTLTETSTAGTSTTTTGTSTETSTLDTDASTGSGLQCSDGRGDAGELCFAPPVDVFVGLPVAALVATAVAPKQSASQDLVIGHSTGVTVLAGDGSGGFEISVQMDTGSVAALAVADLDGDGLGDIAAAHGDSGRVSIAYNDPGGFAFAQDLPFDVEPTPSPSSIAIADFDGVDGPDVVAVDESAAQLHLWLQEPGGGFGAPLSIAIGGSPGEIGVGGLGGSDAPDVAVPNLGGTSVAVLLFNAGSFDITDSVLVGDGPRAVAVTDLDGDGLDDLATADGAGDSASVAFGGAAGIGNAAIYVAGPQPRAVATGDIDNDGRADLVVSLQSANAVAIFLQGDGGAFLSAQWVATPPGPGALAIADFNGDGLGDVAVGSAAGQGGVSLLLSDP